MGFTVKLRRFHHALMLLNYGFTELAYFELKLRRSPYFFYGWLTKMFPERRGKCVDPCRYNTISCMKFTRITWLQKPQIGRPF